MLLFYSNHCTASRMLVESIHRYNGQEHMKLVNVENYKAKGIAIPKQIHSVPALLFTENKTVIFGKQVFDYLLLPGKGYLFHLPKKVNDGVANDSTGTPGEPLSFNLMSSAGDAFSFIEEEKMDPHKSYNWANINENITIPTTDEVVSGKDGMRGNKGLPDLGTLQSQRELQLQNFLQPA